MPTGYTAYIEDNEDATFKGYAMLCARAFGALVMMRDDPLDAAIPEKFEPYVSYHKEKLEESEAKLTWLRSLTSGEANTRAREAHEQCVEYECEQNKKTRELLKRYSKIRKEVCEWSPPSEDFYKYKQFMLDQIDTSTKQMRLYDDKNHMYDYIPEMSGSEWVKKEIKKCERDIDYYKKEIREEYKRTNDRNLWLKQLRNGLDGYK